MIKYLIKRFDKYFLNKALSNFILKKLESTTYKYNDTFYNHRGMFSHPYNNKLALNVLCDKYGSDKGETKQEGHPYGWKSHSYTYVYDMLFSLNRKYVGIVIECGLGTNNPDLPSSMGIDGKPGASLRVWRDYFPQARIIGIDIDRDVLFNDEERIETYYCDQTNSSSIASFIEEAKLTPNSVDIFIDDGLHEFNAGKSLFEGAFPLLRDEGFYIIEDVQRKDFEKYKDYFYSKKELNIKFFDLFRPNIRVGDNRLVVIQKVF